MSSQGPNATQVSGYPFNNKSVRDSSGWVEMKKQKIILNEKTVSPNGYPSDPWQTRSGDRRLDYLNGKFKCTECTGNPFNSNGNPYW
jgi:hypothetical protein